MQEENTTHTSIEPFNLLLNDSDAESASNKEARKILAESTLEASRIIFGESTHSDIDDETIAIFFNAQPQKQEIILEVLRNPNTGYALADEFRLPFDPLSESTIKIMLYLKKPENKAFVKKLIQIHAEKNAQFVKEYEKHIEKIKQDILSWVEKNNDVLQIDISQLIEKLEKTPVRFIDRFSFMATDTVMGNFAPIDYHHQRIKKSWHGISVKISEDFDDTHNTVITHEFVHAVIQSWEYSAIWSENPRKLLAIYQEFGGLYKSNDDSRVILEAMTTIITYAIEQDLALIEAIQSDEKFSQILQFGYRYESLLFKTLVKKGIDPKKLILDYTQTSVQKQDSESSISARSQLNSECNNIIGFSYDEILEIMKSTHKQEITFEQFAIFFNFFSKVSADSVKNLKNKLSELFGEVSNELLIQFIKQTSVRNFTLLIELNEFITENDDTNEKSDVFKEITHEKESPLRIVTGTHPDTTLEKIVSNFERDRTDQQVFALLEEKVQSSEQRDRFLRSIDALLSLDLTNLEEVEVELNPGVKEYFKYSGIRSFSQAFIKIINLGYTALSNEIIENCERFLRIGDEQEFFQDCLDQLHSTHSSIIYKNPMLLL